MQELLQHVLSELRSAWRFRWWGGALAWVAFAGGFVWVASQPDIFEARARVYIDTSSVLRPVLSNQIVPPDIGTELQYVRQALLGREQLIRVARETGLDARVVTPAQLDDVLNDLRSGVRLNVSGGTRSTPDNLYSLSYRNTDRAVAMGNPAQRLDAQPLSRGSARRRHPGGPARRRRVGRACLASPRPAV